MVRIDGKTKRRRGKAVREVVLNPFDLASKPQVKFAGPLLSKEG